MLRTSTTIRNLGLLIVAGIISGLVFTGCNKSEKRESSGVWSKEKAAEWYAQQPWLNGSNFQPSTAINQVEMWSGDTFDAATIDK